MNLKMLLTVTPVLLVFLPVSLSSAQNRSIEAIMKQSIRHSESKHRKQYVLTPGPFSFGDMLVVEDDVPHKTKAQCFNGAPSNPWSQFDFEESHVIWRRSGAQAAIEALEGFGITLSPPKPGKPMVEGEIKIKPGKDAATILAVVYFSGTRQEVSSQELLNYSLKTQWSNDCISMLRSQPYVIVDVFRGSVRIQFAKEMKGQRDLISYTVPSSWKAVLKDGKDTGEFEQDVTLIIARRMKIKSKGSAITRMELTRRFQDF